MTRVNSAYITPVMTTKVQGEQGCTDIWATYYTKFNMTQSFDGKAICQEMNYNKIDGVQFR